MVLSYLLDFFKLLARLASLMIGSGVDGDEYENLCKKYDAMTGARQMDASELICKLQSDDGEVLVLIDARGQVERNVSTIKGSLLLEPIIGLTSTAFNAEDEANLRSRLMKIPKARVVCFCTAGLRSGYVSKELEKRWDRNVFNLHGGIIAFANAGGKLVRPQSACKQTSKVHTYGETWAKYVEPPNEAVY